MRRSLIVSIRAAVVTMVALGLIYPAVVWAISSVLFPKQAGGSVVNRSGHAVGSSLIGQSFTSDRYFNSRPSAAGSGYDAMASGPSNLGPTNKKLVSEVASRVAAAERKNGVSRGSIPVDLVTASGSGLDPDISPDAAYLQCTRVAKARGLSDQRVRDLVTTSITGRQLRFLGEPRVNVLGLNLRLDELK